MVYELLETLSQKKNVTANKKTRNLKTKMGTARYSYISELMSWRSQDRGCVYHEVITYTLEEVSFVFRFPSPASR